MTDPDVVILPMNMQFPAPEPAPQPDNINNRPACVGGRFREMGTGQFVIQCNCGPPCRFCRVSWTRIYKQSPRPPYFYDPAQHGTTYEDIDKLVNPPLRRSARTEKK